MDKIQNPPTPETPDTATPQYPETISGDIRTRLAGALGRMQKGSRSHTILSSLSPQLENTREEIEKALAENFPDSTVRLSIAISDANKIIRPRQLKIVNTEDGFSVIDSSLPPNSIKEDSTPAFSPEIPTISIDELENPDDPATQAIIDFKMATPEEVEAILQNPSLEGTTTQSILQVLQSYNRKAPTSEIEEAYAIHLEETSRRTPFAKLREMLNKRTALKAAGLRIECTPDEQEWRIENSRVQIVQSLPPEKASFYKQAINFPTKRSRTGLILKILGENACVPTKKFHGQIRVQKNETIEDLLERINKTDLANADFEIIVRNDVAALSGKKDGITFLPTKPDSNLRYSSMISKTLQSPPPTSYPELISRISALATCILGRKPEVTIADLQTLTETMSLIQITPGATALRGKLTEYSNRLERAIARTTREGTPVDPRILSMLKNPTL